MWSSDDQHQHRVGDARPQAPLQPYLVRDSKSGFSNPCVTSPQGDSLLSKPLPWKSQGLFWGWVEVLLVQILNPLWFRYGTNREGQSRGWTCRTATWQTVTLNPGGSSLCEILVCSGLQVGPVGKAKSGCPLGIFTYALHMVRKLPSALGRGDIQGLLMHCLQIRLTLLVRQSLLTGLWP